MSDRHSAHYLRIAEMMEGFGQATPQVPTIPDPKTRELRVRLIVEEALEYAAASGVEVRLRGSLDADATLSFAELEFKATGEPDLLEMADGLADLSVVTIGSLVACGIADKPLLEEVDANNLLKVATGHKDPVTGKFIKSPHHPPPGIREVLLRQGFKDDAANSPERVHAG